MHVKKGDEVLVISGKNKGSRGKIVRSAVEEVRATGRTTQGVTFAKPDKGDRIIAVARNPEGSLAEAVEANLDDGDFFLRKGIGWALRQQARVDPDWVRSFVDAHPALSPLSRKEALRHLG